MRLLQNILVVVGTTALGTVLGVAALVLFIGSIQKPAGEPWQRGFGQYLGGLLCGAPLGAVVGLVGSILRIRAQHHAETWSVIVWLGILLGVVVGVVVSFSWTVHDGFAWWGTALFTMACGTVGGMLARMGSVIWKSANRFK